MFGQVAAATATVTDDERRLALIPVRECVGEWQGDNQAERNDAQEARGSHGIPLQMEDRESPRYACNMTNQLPFRCGMRKY